MYYKEKEDLGSINQQIQQKTSGQESLRMRTTHLEATACFRAGEGNVQEEGRTFPRKKWYFKK